MGDNIYTVILLRLEDKASLKRYQFIFLHAQARGELEICFWVWNKDSDDEGLGETLQELGDRSKEHPEWKLVIYDECRKGMEADAEMDRLLRLLSGKKVSGDGQEKIAGAFPVQIFYIQSKEREYVPLGETSSFCCIDKERKFGENFRMLQLEMGSGNDREKGFSEFKLCCALLSLAIGQISYTFMEAGYLYDLDIEIDQKEFGQYMAMLDEKFEEIQECCERERENLKQRIRSVEPLPNVKFPKIRLKENEEREDGHRHIKVLSFREMLNYSDIREVLKHNRKLLMEQMFYPKGLLHEEGEKIHNTVEDMKGTENFLDEAAKALLEKEISETIDEICAQKDAQLEQREFEEQIRRAERMIEEQSDRMMEKKRRHGVLFVFGILELFITEPYLIAYILQGKKYEQWPLCVLTALGTITVVYLGYYLYLWILHKKSWGVYKNRICGQLSEYQKNKKIYLENILALTLKYHYFEKIKGEQRRLLARWDQDKEMLDCHVRMLENSRMGLEPLLYLAGMDGRRKKPGESCVKMDFTKEPREEEYYCLQLHRESCLEINHSGYMTRAGYPFIHRLILKKAIRNETGGVFNG